MHRPNEIVINTGPILALIAGTGSLDVLKTLYSRVLVPYEVSMEILEGGDVNYGVAEFNQATFLERIERRTFIQPFLRNALDLGESAVIQAAIDTNIITVCIDETMGRRVARLNGLHVTGSLGVLIKAKQLGVQLSVRDSINKMQRRSIRLSNTVIQNALRLSNEL
jgi:predicted nucleic acid-binding protein